MTLGMIGEILADMESRISLLENSQSNLSYIKEDIDNLTKRVDNIVQPQWTGKQWDKIQQLQSEVEGWRQKHAEALLAIDKQKKLEKTYQYNQ